MKWAIIGGGVQGCTLFNYLTKMKKASAEDICVIDPHNDPMELWRQYTSRISMSYLRSPVSHHIDVFHASLEQFVDIHADNRESAFSQPHDRPSLALFNQHTQKTLQETQIMKSWIKGRLVSLKKLTDCWQLVVDMTHSQQVFKATNVVLAIGNSEKPNWPEWARTEQKAGKDISHVFDHSFKEENKKGPILICGGGLTGAHLALKYADASPGNVTLATRQPLKVSDFETDLSWLSEEKDQIYQRIHCYEERRNLISSVKEKGSITAEFKKSLYQSVASGALSITHTNSFRKLCANAKTVILATGFQSNPLGTECASTFLKEKVPLSKCGYPILDKKLQWLPSLYCIGGLAELELGPMSRNIAGAKRGSERIVKSL